MKQDPDFDGGIVLEFDSGKKITHYGFESVGLTLGGEHPQVTYGEFGYLDPYGEPGEIRIKPEGPLTRDEKIELALFMVERWQKYLDGLTP